MPHYLIHVGPHKTGTTYLQLRFDAARQRLRQHGIAYPAEWSSSKTESSHRKLVIGLRQADEVQLRARFEAFEHEKPDTVLISAEGINLLQAPAIHLLKSLVGRNPVTLIFYCRRWCELLPSLWQERVKHGNDESFPAFSADNTTDPFGSVVMNFGKRLNLYAGIFGRRAIKLVSYSTLDDDKVDLAKHFFNCFLPEHRLLLDDLPISPMARPNQSFPPRDVEVIRALNAIHRQNAMPPGPALREWYMRNAGRFDLTDLFSAIERSRTTLHLSDDSPEGRRLHDMLFAVYGDLMVQPVVSRRLFSPRDADVAYYEQHYLADASSRRALDDVYAAFRNETAASL